MKLIDAHCHLASPHYHDVEGLIRRSRKAGIVGVIAVGRLVTQLDGLESTVLSGVKEFEPAGTFAYQHAVSKIGYQISPAEHLHVGVAATHIYTQLRDVIGHGLNLDAGFLWEMRPFSWSVSAKNILPFQNKVYSNGGVEDLPLHVATGLNVRFWELEAMAQLKTRESQLLKSVAARLSPSLFSGVMSFSGGVYEEAVLDRKNWRYGVGVGLNLRGLGLHYAYSPSQVYSQAQHHYFSMNLGL